VVGSYVGEKAVLRPKEEDWFRKATIIYFQNLMIMWLLPFCFYVFLRSKQISVFLSFLCLKMDKT